MMRNLKFSYLCILIILVFRTVPAFSIDFSIGLFNDHLVQSVLFTVVDGYYESVLRI